MQWLILSCIVGLLLTYTIGLLIFLIKALTANLWDISTDIAEFRFTTMTIEANENAIDLKSSGEQRAIEDINYSQELRQMA